MRPLAFALALAALACQQPSVDVPEPPDMGGVLRAFQAPSAPLSADTAAEIVAKQQELLAALEDLGGLEPVLAALGAVGGGTESTGSALAVAPSPGTESLASALSGDDLPVSGQGFLTITRVCGGWSGATVPDPADGTIVLTVVFSDALVFDPVVWGVATGCRYRAGERRLTLDGAVHLHTGTLLTERDPGAQLTIDFEGTAQVDDRTFEAAFRFRLVLSSSRVEVDLDVSAGNVVFFADDVTKHYGFRAANGEWTCDFEEGTCARDGDTLRLW